MSKFIILGLDGACPDIIERAVADGIMPNFGRLREMGAWADNIAFPSSVTPGNWTTIATGAKPATIGISDFCMHRPGDPLDKAYSVFTKDVNNRAEFVWDAYADRGYKVATMAYPGSLPQTKPLHLAIGNSGQPTENGAPHTIAPSRALVAGAIHPAGPYGWHEHETVTLTDPGAGPGVDGFRPTGMLTFTVGGTNPGFGGEHAVTLYVGRRSGEPAGVVVIGDETHVVGRRQWTPFIERDFTRDHVKQFPWHQPPPVADTVVGQFRMRLTELDPDTGDVLVYVSTVYPKYAFSSDPEFTQRLRDELGPYNDNLLISRLLMGWLDDDAFRDEFRVQGVWEAKAAVRLIRDHGYQAVLTKWHAFDKFYHFFMQRIDPVAVGYDPAEADRYERLHQVVLGIADEMVGIVLDGLPEDTTLVVTSDHGLMASRRAAWVQRYLAQHGYIAYDVDADGRVVVDWSRTRAYVAACMLLKVNLKGRDPDGIVEPGEPYEALKSELIELLRAWTDPATGEHVMTDVFDPKRDGAFYGLGSDMDGDVRYFTRPGYTLFRSARIDGDETITDSTGPYLGDHGSCRPTTRFGRGGEVGIFYAAGHGIRPVGKRTAPVFMCDIMPTLLTIAGEPPLAQQEGAVLHDLLEETP